MTDCKIAPRWPIESTPSISPKPQDPIGRDEYTEDHEDYDPREETAFELVPRATVRTGKVAIGHPRTGPLQGLGEAGRAADNLVPANPTNNKANQIINLGKNITRLAETSQEYFFDEEVKEATRERDEETERRTKLNSDLHKTKTSRMTTVKKDTGRRRGKGKGKKSPKPLKPPGRTGIPIIWLWRSICKLAKKKFPHSFP